MLEAGGDEHTPEKINKSVNVQMVRSSNSFPVPVGCFCLCLICPGWDRRLAVFACYRTVRNSKHSDWKNARRSGSKISEQYDAGNSP